VYKAQDGSIFEYKEDCLNYEAKINDLTIAINELSYAIQRVHDMRAVFCVIPQSKLFKNYLCRLNFDLLCGQKDHLQNELNTILGRQTNEIDDSTMR
jgi:hypothetical protein